MATLKATVKSKRKDGMYVVYIRFAHNRKVSYLRTSWMVNDKGLSRNKKDILDPFVIQQTSKLIDQYYNTLNRIDTQDWTDKGIPEILILTSHFLQRYKERFLKQPELTANEVAVRFLSRNRTLRIMPVDERINKRIEEYGEYAGEGFLAQDGFCFKLSGEETISGEDPVRISFFTTFMPLPEMSDTQREAIFEECMKDIDALG